MSDTSHNRIVFLSVPESLRGRLDSTGWDGGQGPDGECDGEAHDGHGAAAFSIDPDIPIPVEIPEGEETLNLAELSWEMIISGMLHVIASCGKIPCGKIPGGKIPGGETPERTDYYRRFVLTLRPALFGELTEAAILKARNGGFDLALEILDTLRGLFPDSPVPLLNRALTLEERAALFERQGKQEAEDAYRAAEAAYGEAMDYEPPFPDAWFNGGFFYLGRNDFLRALECFSRFTEITFDEEKKKQAEDAIREIGENGLADDCFREAGEQIRQGREAEALPNIRDFLERYPSVWNGWFMLGWALRRLGRWQDGAAAFGKAVELGGGNSDTRNELAICLMETGDHRAARRELESALRDDPENIKIISNLGVLAMKSGDRAEAAAFFRTVLELDPGDPLAKEFLR